MLVQASPAVCHPGWCGIQVLPSLADTELPQAVALGTKAHRNAVPGWPARFATALRQRVHASASQPAGSAALDSVRLGLVLDKAGSLAAAVLASIDAEWHGLKPASAPGEVRLDVRACACHQLLQGCSLTGQHLLTAFSVVWKGPTGLWHLGGRSCPVPQAIRARLCECA